MNFSDPALIVIVLFAVLMGLFAWKALSKPDRPKPLITEPGETVLTPRHVSEEAIRQVVSAKLGLSIPTPAERVRQWREREIKRLAKERAELAFEAARLKRNKKKHSPIIKRMNDLAAKQLRLERAA